MESARGESNSFWGSDTLVQLAKPPTPTAAAADATSAQAEAKVLNRVLLPNSVTFRVTSPPERASDEGDAGLLLAAHTPSYLHIRGSIPCPTPRRSAASSVGWLTDQFVNEGAGASVWGFQDSRTHRHAKDQMGCVTDWTATPAAAACSASPLPQEGPSKVEHEVCELQPAGATVMAMATLAVPPLTLRRESSPHLSCQSTQLPMALPQTLWPVAAPTSADGVPDPLPFGTPTDLLDFRAAPSLQQLLWPPAVPPDFPGGSATRHFTPMGAAPVRTVKGSMQGLDEDGYGLEAVQQHSGACRDPRVWASRDGARRTPYAPSPSSGLMATAVTGADTCAETSFAKSPPMSPRPWGAPSLPRALGIGWVSPPGRFLACGAEDNPGWPQQQVQVQMQEEEQQREMQQGQKQHHHHHHLEPRSRTHRVGIKNEAGGVEARWAQAESHGLEAPGTGLKAVAEKGADEGAVPARVRPVDVEVSEGGQLQREVDEVETPEWRGPDVTRADEGKASEAALVMAAVVTTAVPMMLGEEEDIVNATVVEVTTAAETTTAAASEAATATAKATATATATAATAAVRRRNVTMEDDADASLWGTEMEQLVAAVQVVPPAAGAFEPLAVQRTTNTNTKTPPDQQAQQAQPGPLCSSMEEPDSSTEMDKDDLILAELAVNMRSINSHNMGQTNADGSRQAEGSGKAPAAAHADGYGRDIRTACEGAEQRNLQLRQMSNPPSPQPPSSPLEQTQQGLAWPEECCVTKARKRCRHLSTLCADLSMRCNNKRRSESHRTAQEGEETARSIGAAADASVGPPPPQLLRSVPAVDSAANLLQPTPPAATAQLPEPMQQAARISQPPSKPPPAKGAVEPMTDQRPVGGPPDHQGLASERLLCCSACSTTCSPNRRRSKGFFTHAARTFTCHACCLRNIRANGFYGPPGTRSLEEAGGRACEACGTTETKRWRPHKHTRGAYVCSRCDGHFVWRGTYSRIADGADGKGAKGCDPRVTSAAANNGDGGSGGGGRNGGSGNAEDSCGGGGSRPPMVQGPVTRLGIGLETGATMTTSFDSPKQVTVGAEEEAAPTGDGQDSKGGAAVQLRREGHQRQPTPEKPQPERLHHAAPELGPGRGGVSVVPRVIEQPEPMDGVTNVDGGDGGNAIHASAGGEPDVQNIQQWVQALQGKVTALCQALMPEQRRPVTMLDGNGAAADAGAAQQLAGITGSAEGRDVAENPRALRLGDLIYRWMKVHIWPRPLALMLGPAAAALALDREGPIPGLNEEEQATWDLSRADVCEGFVDVADAAMGEQPREPVTDAGIRRFREVSSHLAEGLAAQLVLNNADKYAAMLADPGTPEPGWPAVIADVITDVSMSDNARALARGPFRPLLLAVAEEGLRLAFRLGMGAGGPGQLVARTGKVFDRCPAPLIVAPGVTWLRRRVAAQQGPGSITQGPRTAVEPNAAYDVLKVELVRIQLSAVRG